MYRRLFWALPLALGAAACGSDDDGTTPAGTGADPNTLTFTTGDFTIPPGDVFECFYTDVITDRELAVFGASGHQMAGGHHITVYYTDNPQAPTHHNCSDNEMASWHMVAGANTDTSGEPVVALPSGLATKLEKGKQLVVQVHYINTDGKERVVRDDVTVQLGDPSTIKDYANNFFMTDAEFEVPPAGTTKSVSICTVPQDIQTVLLVGHMHEHGKHYRLDQIDEKGEVVDTIYDHDWAASYASHPPVNNYPMNNPLLLKKGTRLRQTCDWTNDTTEPLVFPREMCVMFSMYYPDVGELDCELEFVE